MPNVHLIEQPTAFRKIVGIASEEVILQESTYASDYGLEVCALSMTEIALLAL